ncbi:MAG: XRE family transcriptional regulator [Desulfovibrionaceae bacterium]
MGEAANMDVRRPGLRQRLGLKRFNVRWRIQEYLDREGLNASAIARELGVSSQLVSGTLRGTKHSPRVLDKLREIGVPERYLFDPQQEGKVA